MTPMFCSKCGSALDDKGRCVNPSCDLHTDTKEEKTSKFAFPFKFTTFKEEEKQIVPDCITPDLDEVPIKQYDIARLQTLYKGARAEGRLQVTNKRILFRSSGYSLVGPTSLQYEFSIEEVAGIEIRKEAHFNFLPTLLFVLFSALMMSVFQPVFSHVYNNTVLGIVFSLLISAAAIFFFVLFRKRIYMRYMAMTILISALPLSLSELLQNALGGGSPLQEAATVITVLAFVLSVVSLAFAPNLVIRIITKGGSPAVEIRKKDGFTSFQHNEYTGFSQVTPGPDTDLAMMELGSLIREVQQTGRYTEKQAVFRVRNS